jgi:hypothetical protein
MKEVKFVETAKKVVWQTLNGQVEFNNEADFIQYLQGAKVQLIIMNNDYYQAVSINPQ